jgi:hypothetical protein
MQLVWNKGLLGLNTGEAVEEYLEGPNGSIAVKIVNDLLKIIN